MNDTPLPTPADASAKTGTGGGDDSDTAAGLHLALQRARSLMGLHLALQRAGFIVGTRELLLATQLLVRLQEVGQWSEEPARLKPLLSAVYSKSEADQLRFGAVFDHWLQGRDAWGPVTTEAAATVGRINPLARVTVPDSTSQQRWVIVAVVALVVAGAAWRTWEQHATPPVMPPAVVAPVAEPADGPAPANASGPAGAGPVSTLRPTSPDGHVGFEPQQVRQREFRPWVMALLLALPLPLLLLVYAPALALSRRNLDRQRQHSGVKLDVSAWRSEAERVVPVIDPQTAARLDRHVRASADDSARSTRRMLDPARTLAATLRHHGQLTLRWRARRTRPSYLVLLDVRDENDLRGRLFFRWSDRLRREGVNVEIWLFNGDPRVLYPAHQRRVLDASGAERNAVRFEQVAQRAVAGSAARLVLVSDGAGFFDSAGMLQDWWPLLGWQRWTERIMFTPVDSRDWSDREVAIERPLGRTDPGFLVLPLEAEALDAYAVLLTRGDLPAIVLSGARRFPPLLDKLPQGGLAPEPPPQDQVEKLIAQLRLYLGENGLRWLAACAVPPVSRWELTLLIGQELFRNMGAADETQLRWLMHSNYARLARLPWLRNAAFPDWLALRLLDELSPPVQERVRQVVRRLLDQVPTEQAADASDVLALDCSPPGAGTGASGAEERRAPSDTQRRRQWLYLGFLDGLTPRQLAMRAPSSWRQWLAAPRGPARGLRAALAFVADWLRALLARLMWRDGRAEGGVSRWPLALAAAWLLGCGLLLQRLADEPEADLAPALAQALFIDKRIDAGVASDVPYQLITFSGDGKRFATVDAAGEVQVRENDVRAEAVGPPMQLSEAPVALFLDPKGERLVVVDAQGWARQKAAGALHWSAATMVGPGFGPVLGVSMDAARVRAAGWSQDGKLRITDLGGLTWIVDVEGEGGEPVQAVMQAVFAPDGSLVVLRGGARSLYSPITGKRLDRPGSQTAIATLAQRFPADPAGTPPRTVRQRWLSPDGSKVVVAYSKPGADIVTYVDGTRREGSVQRLPDVGTVQEVGFDSRGGVRLVDFEGRVISLDADGRETGAPLQAPGLPLLVNSGPANPAVTFAGDATVLLARSAEPVVDTWRVADAPAPATGLPLQQVAAGGSELAGITAAEPMGRLGLALALSGPAAMVVPHGDALVTTDTHHELRLWRRAASQELPAPLNLGLAQRDAPSAVAITADGRWAASGDADGFVQVWNVRSGRIRTRIDTKASAVHALVLSADGSRLTSLGGDGRARAWDAASGTAVGGPVGERLLPERFAANLDGTRLLAWRAGNVQLWRVGAAGLQAGAQVQSKEVVSAAFDERSDQFLTAHADGQVQVWSATTGGRVSLFTALRLGQADTPAASAASAASATSATSAAAVSTAISTANVATVTVPSVLGRPLAAARQTLGELGFALRVSALNTPSRALPGTVAQMSPSAGTALRRGGTVQLAVAGSACRSGFVERGAFVGDSACVSVQTQEQVQRDNANAPSRIDRKDRSFGTETCVQGLVWREADRAQRGEKFADKVCVIPEQRQQAVTDNASQRGRLAEGFGFLPAPAAAALASATATAPAPAPAPAPASRVAERLQHASFVVDLAGRTRLLVRSDATASLVGSNGTQATPGPLVSHSGIRAAAYSPQDGLIITAGADGTLRFWAGETGAESLPSLHHGAPINRLAVTADGRHAVSTDSGGNLRVWNLAARRGVSNLTTRASTPKPARPWVNFALDGTGTHLVVAGNHTPAGVAARLPTFQTGELRVVRPYVLFWLAALGLVVLGGVVVLVLAARRRTQLIDRLVAGVESPHASPVAEPVA